MTQQTLSFTQGDETWHRLRKRCLSDLFFLCDVVLGFGAVVPITRRAHYSLCKFAERQTGHPDLDKKWIRFIKVPRSVGKSTCVTQGYGIQLALKYPDIAILITNETERGAMKFLDAIKQQFTDNAMLRALFPERIPLNPEKDCRKWSATEVVLPRSTTRQESTFSAIGVGGAITGQHPDVAIVDDMFSDDAMENARAGVFSEFDKINRWIDRLRPLVNSTEPHHGILVVGCIARGSRVLMENGTWKPIQDVEVGEKVWSYDVLSQSLMTKKVTGVIPQGVAPTVTVKTDRHELRTTPDHPFLAASGGSRPHMAKWRRADKLLSTTPAVVETLQGLPERDGSAPTDWMWLLGFMWGDGWVTKYEKGDRVQYSVHFAHGSDSVLAERVAGIFKNLFGCNVKRGRKGCTRIESREAAETLERAGLTPGVGAKEKRLPQWLFGAAPHEKREFLAGLICADGHSDKYIAKQRKSKPRFRLSTSSRRLAYDVYDLALTCQVRPCRPWTRTRTIKAPHSPEPIVSTEYIVALAFEPEAEPLRRWKVRSVEESEPVEVFDLTVEDTANFFCEGFCVHNTPWFEGDSYDYIEKSFGYGEQKQEYKVRHQWEQGTVEVSCYVVGDLAVYHRPILENGTSFFPERWPDDKIAKLRAASPELCAANMDLNPTSPEIVVFKPMWKRYFQWDGINMVRYRDQKLTDKHAFLDDLDVVMSVDPGFTEGGNTSSRQAIIVTGGVDENLRLLLKASAERQSQEGFLRTIVDDVRKYRPRKLLLEKAGQQIAWIGQVRQALNDADLRVSIEEVVPGGKNPNVRIATLETFFERGQILGHLDQHDFWREYDGFPRSKFNDLLVALSYQPPFWHLSGNPTQSVPNRQKKRVDDELNRLYQKMGVSARVGRPGNLREDGTSR